MKRVMMMLCAAVMLFAAVSVCMAAGGGCIESTAKCKLVYFQQTEKTIWEEEFDCCKEDECTPCGDFNVLELKCKNEVQKNENNRLVKKVIFEWKKCRNMNNPQTFIESKEWAVQ